MEATCVAEYMAGVVPATRRAIRLRYRCHGKVLSFVAELVGSASWMAEEGELLYAIWWSMSATMCLRVRGILVYLDPSKLAESQGA